MAEFILQMEREIEIVRAEMEDESNRVQEKKRILYEKEKESDICQLKKCINNLKNEVDIYRGQLQCFEKKAKLNEHEKTMMLRYKIEKF